jgi:hypothetical protein
VCHASVVFCGSGANGTTKQSHRQALLVFMFCEAELNQGFPRFAILERVTSITYIIGRLV